MKVILFTNGAPPDRLLAEELVQQHKLIIATDGAAEYLKGFEIFPHVICGDFDSIQMNEAKAHFNQSEFIHLNDQNFGDLEKAIRLARERGATHITIAGAVGGRLDHTLGNILLLAKYHKDISLSLIESNTEMFVISGTERSAGEILLYTKPQDTVSLFALANGVRVTANNVEWPLSDEVLPMGTHGVSNIATSNEVIIKARGGMLIVCHSKIANQ